MSITTPRQLVTQQTNYLRKHITFADYGATVTVGWLPPNAIVTGGYVQITTAFNSSGTDLIDIGFIGTTTDDNGYASALVLSALATLAFDELATATNVQDSAVIQVTAKPAQSVADATAGAADIVVFFVPNNDG